MPRRSELLFLNTNRAPPMQSMHTRLHTAMHPQTYIPKSTMPEPAETLSFSTRIMFTNPIRDIPWAHCVHSPLMTWKKRASILILGPQQSLPRIILSAQMLLIALRKKSLF